MGGFGSHALGTIYAVAPATLPPEKPINPPEEGA